MRREVRVYVTDPLSDRERRQLISACARHLPANIGPQVRSILIEELAHAAARAKASMDLPKAMKRNRALNRSTTRARKRGALPLKSLYAPLHGLKPTQRVQTWPSGRGRPQDTWKHVLYHDITVALRRAGISAGWKTGFDTTTKKIFRDCARIAGYTPRSNLKSLDGDLRGIYERAKHLSVELHPDPPKALHR